ncbi:MAG: sodium-dependent bicarbonate transport family permease [Chitinophagaceae bacterium]|nr:sodium-dependent bicarbonate transport family permease [Chitinophagaceae bacterium]
MNMEILVSNLTNPTLLFFILGIIAAVVKSDLEIPSGSVKFISLYLLFSIGFKGGQELAHSGVTTEILITLIIALCLAAIVPLYSFFILKRKLNVYDAGAVAAAYGSVSAVTFVAASAFLEAQQIHYGGHMVAAMALMEAPAIIIGVMLIRKFDEQKNQSQNLRYIVHDALSNGSVLMIMGSLIIGIVADTKQAEGIKPFTSDIFKGFLAVFLLEMGMVAAKRFKAFRSYGWFVTIFGLLMPPINGILSIFISSLFEMETGNRFLLAILQPVLLILRYRLQCV